MPISLTSRERSHLKARAHALDAVVTVGQHGVSDGVVAEVDRALTAHELIKVRIGGDDRAARKEMCEEIAVRTEAALVHTVGKIAIFWRPRPDEDDPS